MPVFALLDKWDREKTRSQMNKLEHFDLKAIVNNSKSMTAKTKRELTEQDFHNIDTAITEVKPVNQSAPISPQNIINETKGIPNLYHLVIHSSKNDRKRERNSC